MKRLIFLAACLFAPCAHAQKEPEYINDFAAIDAKTQALIPLPIERGEAKARMRALGLGGAASYLEFQGAACAVRLKSSSVSFLFKAPSQDTNPQSTVQIFKVVPVRATRQLTIQNYSPVGTSISTAGSVVAFSAEKYGKSSFKVTPTSALAPGEYLLSSTNSQVNGFCFGVDD